MSKDLSKILSSLSEQSEEREAKVEPMSEELFVRQLVYLHNGVYSLQDEARRTYEKGLLEPLLDEIKLLKITKKTIEYFLTNIDKETEETNSRHLITGQIISSMIQNAYNHGENEFNLNIYRLYCPDDFLIRLEGTPSNPIKIVTHGRVSLYCGAQSKHVDIDFHGHFWDGFAALAEHSTFTIRNRQRFQPDTMIEIGVDAQDCIFKSPHTFPLTLVHKKQNNQLILIKEDGTEVPYNA